MSEALADPSATTNHPLSLIVAISRNGVIGNEDDLPWRLSSDLRRFKQLTMGHHIIMGRKTLDSIGRLLPGRQTVVLSRQKNFEFPGAQVVHSPEEALAVVANDQEPFVIGGRQIYEALLPFTGRLYLTRVLADVEGDTCWDLDPAENWELREVTELTSTERDQYDTQFEIWDRLR